MSILPVRHALRSLRRTPAFSITAALTLVIGIAATVAIFTVVNGVLLHPLPYGDPGRLVGAWHDLPPISLMHAQQTAGTYWTYKKLAHTIDGIALHQETAVNVGGPGDGGEPQRISAARVTADLIPLLRVPPRLGRNFTAAEDLPNSPDVVIISDGLWRTRFGADPRIVGRKMNVNGTTREIVGVMPPHFRFPTGDTRLWLPMRLDPNGAFSGGFNFDGIARLKPGVSVADAQRDFAGVLPRIIEISPNLAPGISTQMMLDQAKPRPLLVPFLEDMTRDIAKPLWMVGAAAVLVLLVACFNVANLMLVRADARQRELAVREALGAGRARVLAHFFAESMLLTGVAAIAGLFLAWLCVRALVVVGAGAIAIPRLSEVTIDGASVVFTLLLATVVALVCGLVPALRIGRVRLSNALREGGRTGTATRVQHRVRGALVAAQIALALIVLAASGVLLRTFQQLRSVKPGFDADHVATFWLSLPGGRYKDAASVTRFYANLTARVSALPGVRVAGITSRLPLETNGMSQDPLYPENDATYATKIPPLQLFTTTDSGYFGAMGIPLVAGRMFSNLATQRVGEAIVSRATAEHFWHDATGRTAVGKRFRELPTGPLFTVVGVVGSVRDTALAAAPSQTIYLPEVASTDSAWKGFNHVENTMALVVRTAGDPGAITADVQRLIRELDPTLPTFDVKPMSVVVRASMARLSFITVMLAAAAVVTLLLGAIGLYGVMAYLVALRVRELSVRIALGAQPSAVAAMMTRQGLALTAIGVGVGLAGFAMVARFLRSFLFGVAPTDPVALSAASLTLVAIAALASWIPARRASRVDPAAALRAE